LRNLPIKIINSPGNHPRGIRHRNSFARSIFPNPFDGSLSSRLIGVFF
jgi:hypothetical protein